MNNPIPRSVVIVFRFRGCRPEALVSGETENHLGDFFEKMVRAAGFVPVARYVKIYENGAYTAEVTLEESKAALYTWPEDGDVEGLIFYCNYEGDNADKAESLFNSVVNYYQPEDVERFPSIQIFRKK